MRGTQSIRGSHGTPGPVTPTSRNSRHRIYVSKRTEDPPRSQRTAAAAACRTSRAYRLVDSGVIGLVRLHARKGVRLVNHALVGSARWPRNFFLTQALCAVLCCAVLFMWWSRLAGWLPAEAICASVQPASVRSAWRT